VLTDVTGTVQNAYGYEAFGEEDYALGTIENKYLFTGEQYDNNVGFYYLRARFYNPSNGRFQNMDTFAGRMHEPQSLHKYMYAHANPVMNLDPSGNAISTLFDTNTARGIAGILAGYGIASNTSFTLYRSSTTADDDYYDPFTLGWLAILASTVTNTAIQSLADSLTRERDHDTRDLFRAVEDVEMLSIWECNCFSLGPSLFPKQFWTTYQAALTFGRTWTLRFTDEFYIVKVTVSDQMFNALHNTDADTSIGDARTLPNALLPAFNGDVHRHGGILELGVFK
jgi:RHS repeat-associated protein